MGSWQAKKNLKQGFSAELTSDFAVGCSTKVVARTANRPHAWTINRRSRKKCNTPYAWMLNRRSREICQTMAEPNRRRPSRTG